jgi:hypothetical protein
MSGISTVIVIDALDECKDEESTSAILSVLGRLLSEIHGVKFFLTGRPEPRIKTGFRLPLLAKVTDIFVLHHVEPNPINNDIQLFLKHSFQEIADRRGGLDAWPAEEDVDRLRERSAGLFVFAIATIRFIYQRNRDPRRQLELLLQSPESSRLEGKAKLNTKTTLDSLYTSILQEAFGDDDPETDLIIRSVLGAVLLAANPLSPSTIAMLLGSHPTDVSLHLLSLHSLLKLQDDINHPVQPFHKSFPDFITDPTRCTNKRFHISAPTHHQELLIGCLNLMNQKLKKNMCKLPGTVMNPEVDEVQQRTEEHISPALRYAAESWYKHLKNGHVGYTSAACSAIDQFLREKFLFWLEVLSILGALKEAVNALEVAIQWLKVSLILAFGIHSPHFKHRNPQLSTLQMTASGF